VSASQGRGRTPFPRLPLQQNRGWALTAATLDGSSLRVLTPQETTAAAEAATAAAAAAASAREAAASVGAGALYATATAPDAAAVDARIVRLALPAMCGALIDPVLSLVDTAWVGRLGAAPLAALGPCCEIFTFSFWCARPPLLRKHQNLYCRFDFLKYVIQQQLTCSTLFAFISVCWALREATTALVGAALASGDGAEAADVVDASLAMALVLGAVLAWAIRAHAAPLLAVRNI